MSKKRKTKAQFVAQPTELWAGRTENGKDGVAVLRVMGWVTTNDEYGFVIEPVVSDHNMNGLLRPLSVTVNQQIEYSDDPDYWNKRERPYTVVTPCTNCGATDTICNHTRIGEVVGPHTQGRDRDWSKGVEPGDHHHEVNPVHPCTNCGASLGFCDCGVPEQEADIGSPADTAATGWSAMCECDRTLPMHGLGEHEDNDQTKPLRYQIRRHFGIED